MLLRALAVTVVRRLRVRPTPKAEDRVYHKAHKMKRAAERRAATGTNRKFQTRLGGKRASDELVTGRNAVLEGSTYWRIPSKHLGTS